MISGTKLSCFPSVSCTEGPSPLWRLVSFFCVEHEATNIHTANAAAARTHLTNSFKILSDGCTTDYEQSEVKYVVDAWANSKLNDTDLKEDNLGYKTRLLTFEDLINSTDDRLIVFYNFDKELQKLKSIISNRPISIVNGQVKDLNAYENENNSITFIQYQAGAMGLNLQKANKIIYYSLPLSSELYEQSKKRIHRIGQKQPCFYYILQCNKSVEVKILNTLQQRKDYTAKLFDKDF